ncbi:MAG TPA: caspase family protein, partial [Hyphomicrobiaceae bacterium]|nr:caspase family protein [Hyphomicrobiaceae bacterium]
MRLVAALFFLLSVLAAEPAHAQGKRVALVIGNEAYAHASALKNPVRDAAAVAAALKRIGFELVEVQRNLGVDALRRALLAFEGHATGADIALVFFAGHGIEVDGVNYLVPTDARLTRANGVELEAVALPTVTAAISGARKLRLVILDSCRNNPFQPRLAADSGRKRSIGRGLARVEPGDNELIAFAAAAGTTADDGEAGNSPFTTALLKHLERPGLEVQQLFRNVRDEVIASTARGQVPHVYGTLGAEPVFFRAALASVDTVKANEAEIARRVAAERARLEAEMAARLEAEKRRLAAATP